MIPEDENGGTGIHIVSSLGGPSLTVILQSCPVTLFHRDHTFWVSSFPLLPPYSPCCCCTTGCSSSNTCPSLFHVLSQLQGSGTKPASPDDAFHEACHLVRVVSFFFFSHLPTSFLRPLLNHRGLKPPSSWKESPCWVSGK